MSTQEYIRSITSMTPDDFPTLTPLPETTNISSNNLSNNSFFDYFTNVSWQTWVIVVLILALLGINIFAYLAKGTQETVDIFNTIFGPILQFFGYSTLETTKQTIETTATGTKAGVDIVAGATTGAINTVEKRIPASTSGTSVGISTDNIPQGQSAKTSLPVQRKIQEIGADDEQWQPNSLEKALEDASTNKQSGPTPNDSSSSLQTTGKAGWCFIGEEKGIRTCSEIGANDMCMSGDIFPTQAVCMNPRLRA